MSWDDIRDAIIINGLVVGGNSSPLPKVTGLLSSFLLHVDSTPVILWKKEVGTVAMLLTLNARSAICIGLEQV